VPDLSVVIVSYRTPDLLRRCLERLAADTSPRSREILVVDNRSGDESAEVARSFPGVRVVEAPQNLGFAGGVNLGLAEGTGDYIVIMNPDVEVHPGALDILIDFLEAHPQTGIAGPKLLNTDGSLQYSCRRRYTLKAILYRRTFLGKLFPNSPDLRRYLMLDYDHAAPRAVDWVAGAAMMVRREAVNDVGPMEERYFLYFEDVDWCTRMQTRGWLVHYVPDAVMVHHWQRASWGFGPAARRHLRSGLRFYDRWGGLLYVLRLYRESVRSLGLLGLDLVAVSAAFVSAYLLRQLLAPLMQRPMWPLSFYGGFFVGSLVVYTVAFYLQGLYRGTKEGDWVDVAFRVIKGASLAALLLMAGTFIFKMRAYSRAIVLGSWPLVIVFTILARRLVDALFARVRRRHWNLRRIALVGQDPVLDRIEEMMRGNPDLGWEPIRLRRLSFQELPVEEAAAVLIKQLQSERISDVVITADSLLGREEDLARIVLPLRRGGIGVRLVAPFLASLSSRARLEFNRGVSWLTLDRPVLGPSSPSKRLLDIGLALLFLLLGALPLAVVGVGRLGSRKNLWEPETRFVGRWGEILTVRRLAGGGGIRSYPLLGNVLKGQLSLVGPRPVAPGAGIPGGESWRRTREHYRPGLVGPWSLTPGATPEEEMQQELRYLETWSTETDLKLLARVALARWGGGSDRGSPSPAPREHSHSEASTAGDSWRAHSSGI
jgi:hypothetical protein